MSDFYPEIRAAHIIAVIASGTLFFGRGLALNLGARWVMTAPLRYLSYTIDSVLFAAAVLLTTIVHQYPFINGWLTVKVSLLVVYIVLGTFALKRGRTRTTRLVCWLTALVVFAFIISVARAHQPLGVFATLVQ